MYKFSRCHVIIFHGFFVPFTIFDKDQPVSGTNRLEIARRFSKKLADLSVKLADLSVFLISLFLCSLRCVSAEFSRFSPFFTEFFKN
jgi:hypothetical protein